MLRFDYQPAPDAVGLHGYPLLDNCFHYWADMYGEDTWDWNNDFPADFDEALIKQSSEQKRLNGCPVWHLGQNTHGYLITLGLKPGLMPVSEDMAKLEEEIGMPVAIYAHQDRLVELDSCVLSTGRGDHLVLTAFFSTIEEIEGSLAACEKVKALRSLWEMTQA